MKCEPCNEVCYWCTDGTEYDCTLCDTNSKYRLYFDLNTTCLENCYIGFYEFNDTCIACH